MAGVVLYLDADRDVKVTGDDVYVGDVAEIFCEQSSVASKAAAVKIYHFNCKDKDRVVISILKIMQEIQKVIPGVEMQTVGETAVLLVKVQETGTKKGTVLKVILVCLICFFGTAFTIMAFHNDIGIERLFFRVYELVTGEQSSGFTILEVMYSIGLSAGILIFFNHVGKLKITKDPTPIEVEMRKYETDVYTTLVENAEREGTDVHVD